MFLLKTRWLKDYRYKGRSKLTIIFSYDITGTKISYGTMTVYHKGHRIAWKLGRITSIEVY